MSVEWRQKTSSWWAELTNLLANLFLALFIYYRRNWCPAMPFHVQMCMYFFHNMKAVYSTERLPLPRFCLMKNPLGRKHFQQSNHQKKKNCNPSHLQMLIEDKWLNKPPLPLCLGNANNKTHPFYVVLLNVHADSQTAWILIVGTIGAGELFDLPQIKK